jgi:hypothetical protein
MDEQTFQLNDEFEEIDGDEVDEVIEALETLAHGVESDSLRAILEDAAEEVHQLFYGDESETQAA